MTEAGFLETMTNAVEPDEGSLVGFAVNSDGDRHVCIASPDAPDTLTEWGKTLNPQGYNIYWSAAVMRPGLPPNSRGKLEDIECVAAIVIDLDTPEQAQRYENGFRPLGIEPTAVVRTSTIPASRYQIVYKLDEPTHDTHEWRECALKLRHAWGADSCSSDPAHVWRIPGFTNWPNEKKRAEGRIAETAELVHADWSHEVSLHDFDDLERPPEADQPTGEGVTHNVSPTQDWAAWGEIAQHLPAWMQDALLDGRIMNGQRNDRSEWDYQIAKEAVRAGLSLGDYALLYRLGDGMAHVSKLAEKYAVSEEVGDKYLKSTYANAHAKLTEAGESIPDAPSEHEPEPEPESWAKYVFGLSHIKTWPKKELTYLVEPIIIEGAIHCIHGGAGSGKSYYLAHLLYNLAQGQHVGPYMVREPRRVLYIDAEMSERNIQERYYALEAAYGTDTADNYLTFGTNIVPRDAGIKLDLREGETQKNVLAMAKEVGAEVICIDNVRAAADNFPENDAHEWKSLDDFWEDLRREGFTVVWVHHNRKDKDDPTFAGSEAAIRGTEVVIGLVGGGQDKVDKLADMVKTATTQPDEHGEEAATFSVRHSLKVHFTKHRDWDGSQHRKHELMYVRRLSDDVTQLQPVPEDDDTDLDECLRQLGKDEQVYALHAGYAGHWTARQIAGRCSISPNRVEDRVRRVEADPSARARVVSAFTNSRFAF